MSFDISSIHTLWKELRTSYGLRRLKGNIQDIRGVKWHIEATPGQCRVSPFESRQAQLVLIGLHANNLTRSILNNLLFRLNNRREVDTLIDMYHEYQKITQVKSRLLSKLAKAKVKGITDADLIKAYEAIENDLQVASDKMTFANPVIWMLYKFEAYIDDPQPIRTLHDLRVHCSKEGYVCTKRLHFLNKQLEKFGVAPLSDGSIYPDDILLNKLLDDENINRVIRQETFIQLWDKYEYYRINIKAAKWNNYPMSE